LVKTLFRLFWQQKTLPFEHIFLNGGLFGQPAKQNLILFDYLKMGVSQQEKLAPPRGKDYR